MRVTCKVNSAAVVRKISPSLWNELPCVGEGSKPNKRVCGFGVLDLLHKLGIMLLTLM